MEESILIESAELKYNLQQFKRNENHIEYFKSIFLDNIRANPTNVQEILDEVMNIAKNNNYNIAYAWCLIYKGWDYHIRCEYDKACHCRIEASEIFIKNNDINGQIAAYNALLADYSRLGNLDLAIESGLMGIELADQENEEELLIDLLINTSVAYTECKKYTEAKELLNKIKSFHGSISKDSNIAYYITLAEIEVNNGDFNYAYECCENAYELIKEIKCWIYECEVLSIRAVANFKMGKLEEAEKDFILAIENARSFNNTIFVIRTLIRFSNYYDLIGNNEQSVNKLIEAYNEIKKISSPIDESEIYYKLSELYSRNNKMNEAYKYLKMHLEIEKKIFNSKSSNWFDKMHSKEIAREAKIYKEMYQDIDLISDIGKKFTSNLKIEKNLNVIYEEVRELMEADVFGIALYKNNLLYYDLFIVDGNLKDYGSVALDEETFGGWCYKNKKNVLINDIEKEYNKYISSKSNELGNCNFKDIQSLVFCPIIIESKVIGILSVQSYNKNAYNKNDIKKLEISTSYIAIALENARLFNKIEYAATHDGLTEILNREEILNRGEFVLKNKENCSIILIDIDYFKSINDNYGHAAGDYVLKSISTIMQEIISENGYIGRFGGEEFLIVIYDCNFDKVMKIAEQLRSYVENYKFIVDSQKIDVTVSLGTYNYCNGDKNFYNNIKFADKALYMAKALGRNKVISYNDSIC